jgi:hypothetical protein
MFEPSNCFSPLAVGEFRFAYRFRRFSSAQAIERAAPGFGTDRSNAQNLGRLYGLASRNGSERTLAALHHSLDQLVTVLAQLPL